MFGQRDLVDRHCQDLRAGSHLRYSIAKTDSCPGPGLGGTVLLGQAIPRDDLLDSTTELPLSFMVTPLSATNLTVDVGMDGLCLLSSSLIWSGSSGHLPSQPPLADCQPPNSRRALESFHYDRHWQSSSSLIPLLAHCRFSNPSLFLFASALWPFRTYGDANRDPAR
jgi:hypothetical protein